MNRNIGVRLPRVDMDAAFSSPLGMQEEMAFAGLLASWLDSALIWMGEAIGIEEQGNAGSKKN